MNWQVAALSTELTEKPLGVTVEGIDYALFRDTSGQCRAVRDRCAHRRAPLSLGRITPEGLIECPYHGWRYDGGSGACRVIPNLSASERVPPAYRIPAFATCEAGGFVFIWLSSLPAAGSVSDLPVVAPDTQFGRKLVAIPRNLYVDVLLDSPSAVLETGSLSIIDNHRYRDPVLTNGCIVVSFALAPTKTILKGLPVADYPFVLTMEVPLDEAPIRLQLDDQAGNMSAALLLTTQSRDYRLTQLLWRADGPLAGAIRPRDSIDVARVAKAGDYLSRFHQTCRTQLKEAALT
jgi:nitrite reductase/ring-hydroxylating ferredoxin subunit